MEEERAIDDQALLRAMEKHPRCALLPSPDILETAALRGEDVTGTLDDYAAILAWVTECGLLNTGFYQPAGLITMISSKQRLSKLRYGALVQLAFNNAFAPLLHTGNLNCEELVLWYYAGHGLGNKNIKSQNLSEKSAVPQLEKVDFHLLNRDLAKPFMPEHSTRTVKGGELCLHHVGFCDLNGLLEAWIAALKGKSQSIKGPGPDVKQNKHLVLILDSCYAGTFANDLKTLAQEPGPWNENGCTVTVQASCSGNEPTFGGYFTPLFLYLNQHPEDLKKLIEKWQNMADEEKAEFLSLPFPSPIVETTRNSDGSNLLVQKIECQNFSIHLFPDAGFFKFCYVTWSQKQYGCSRALTSDLASNFLSQSSFTVCDYKLKKISPSDPDYANTPMGLFLVNVDDPNHVGYKVCIHIHFLLGSTTHVTRINLVPHLLQHHPGVMIYYAEKGPKQPVFQSTVGWSWNSADVVQGVPPQKLQKFRNLVQECHDEVERSENGRWSDISRWNMKGIQLGVKGLCRLEKRLNQRSLDLNNYLRSLEAT